MMHFDEWWNSAAADSFRAKHEDQDGEVFRPVWDAALLSLAATPALPATEDSSAGDLAEGPAGSGGWKVHAESLEKECAYWKTIAETMRAHACKDVWYWQGDGSDNPASMVNSLAVVIRADQLRDLLAQSQGEVQAEPVDWDELPEDANERAMFDRNLGLYGGDPRVAIATALRLWANTRGNGSFGLMCAIYANEVAKMHIAAPQAQPADALDAAFEAVRKRFCKLPRYSFLLDGKGNVRRVPNFTGNWVEFEAAHTLFDPQSVDAAMAAAQEGGNAAKEA